MKSIHLLCAGLALLAISGCAAQSDISEKDYKAGFVKAGTPMPTDVAAKMAAAMQKANEKGAARAATLPPPPASPQTTKP